MLFVFGIVSCDSRRRFQALLKIRIEMESFSSSSRLFIHRVNYNRNRWFERWVVDDEK